MKTLIVAAALAVAAFAHAGPAAAQEANANPWCAQEQNGANNCTFATFQQCLETIQGGEGGSCSRNPAFAMRRGEDAYAYAPARRASRAMPQAGSDAVYGTDGKYLGTDPDPNIRFELRRDQNWE